MTAMQSLSDAPLTATLDGATMPRFQDGTINVQELLRLLANSKTRFRILATAHLLGRDEPSTRPRVYANISDTISQRERYAYHRAPSSKSLLHIGRKLTDRLETYNLARGLALNPTGLGTLS